MTFTAKSLLKDPDINRAFQLIKRHCDPSVPKTASDIIDLWFPAPFIGGCGYGRRTTHEAMFAMMCPDLKRQVSFGTGKNGLSIWGTKRYIADFYDEAKKIVYEIDGKPHRKELQRLKDALRDRFFASLGIKTGRVTNKQVEELVLKRLKQLKDDGQLSLLFENVGPN